MTEQEAIKIFKDRLELTDYRKQVPEYYEAMELAVKALEKQITKKPIDRCMFKECPNCGEIEIQYCNHCPMCGQKLDWGEEE